MCVDAATVVVVNVERGFERKRARDKKRLAESACHGGSLSARTCAHAFSQSQADSPACILSTTYPCLHSSPSHQAGCGSLSLNYPLLF